MAAVLDFFSTYTLMAIADEIVPQQTFFKDRYFPTGEEDIFAADKVLVEYRDGDRKLAPFVAERVGDIPIDRRGYEIHEFQPPFIAPSRFMTVDDLRKRGFGEALYSNSNQAERAARIHLQDLTDLEKRIVRREEWMCAQTMINNACTMQEYLDASTAGNVLEVQFYDTVNDAKYTPSALWTTWPIMEADVEAMCDLLARRGQPMADLVLGSTAWNKIKNFPELLALLDNRRLELGTIAPQNRHPGVTWGGRLNFNGYDLDIWVIKEQYENDAGQITGYFPAKGAMVTAPNSGHLMYGQITQIDHGSTEFTTYAAKRVPKFTVDQPNDARKMALRARPLAAPRNKSPWIFAADVV